MSNMNPTEVNGSEPDLDGHKVVIRRGIDIMSYIAHQNSLSKGFYEGVPYNRGEKISLMHQELSELLDAYRAPAMKQSEKIPGFTEAEEELADLIIRAGDHAGKENMRLGEAILAKMEYNSTRPHKHGRKF